MEEIWDSLNDQDLENLHKLALRYFRKREIQD